MDAQIVRQLSDNASAVLLSLLLTRQREPSFTQAEFATLTELRRHMPSESLMKLEQLGLIAIIHQSSSRAQPYNPNIERQYQDELETVPQAEETTEGRNEEVFADDVQGRADGELQSESSEEVAEQVESSDRNGRTDFLGACRYADEHQDKRLQVSALKRVWQDVFPLPQYEYQQLSDDFAKRLLVGGRSSLWVAEVIVDAVSHTKQEIKSPRRYIEVAIANAERKRQAPIKGKEVEKVVVDEAEEVDMDLMRTIMRGYKSQRLGEEQKNGSNTDN